MKNSATLEISARGQHRFTAAPELYWQPKPGWGAIEQLPIIYKIFVKLL
jgi:hypothetical protein